jgi:cytochrome c-type biogenesis protein CcmH/NrfF
MRTLTWIPLVCALLPGRAHAQSPGAHTRPALPDARGTDLGTAAIPAIPPPPEFEYRPRSDFENALMGELSCTCGTCELEPINTCKCKVAAKMRAEVLDELDTHDLSTETGRRVAADSVRASRVAKYGPKVLHHLPEVNAALAVAGGVVVIVVAIGVRTLRGRRRRGGGEERDDFDASER